MRILSGIQPSGDLHIGNYLGAIKRFVELQEEHECFFFIADLHALTQNPNPDELRASVLQTAIDYLSIGIDPLAQALGGLMAVTGLPDGAPLKTGSPIVDATTAHLVVISALAALRRRDQRGQGELIEVNLLDALFNLQPTLMSQYLVADHEQPATGCGSDLMSPYGQFQSKDGRHWQVTALNQKFFANLCEALECTQLLADTRFTNNDLRLQNNDALEQELARIIQQFDSAELEQRFAQADVMAAPVNSIAEAVRDPQLLHNGMITELEHAHLGRIKSGTLPIRFADESTERVQRAAPTLGQHTEEVLSQLGYSDQDIAELRESGAIT